jgi:hypothetical protein
MGSAAITPIIGSWYNELVQDLQFEVVAIDDASGNIEIQYLGGEIGEFDMETWRDMTMISCHAPEDAGIAYELSQEDELNDDLAMTPINNSPLASIEGETFQGFDDF